MALAAAVLLLAPREWAGYWYEQIQRASLIVAGEVVDLRPHGDGNQAALFRVDLVLHGEAPDRPLVLPFKRTLTFSCDYEITYEKAKYLLLIDDLQPFRLVWFPDYAQIRIPDYEAPEVRFTRAVLDPEKRILDLEAALRKTRPDRKGDVAAFVSTLPRSVVRPLLPALRRELGPGLRDTIGRAKPGDRFRYEDEYLVSTFDLALVEKVLQRPEPFGDPFYPTAARRERGEQPISILSRIIGRRFDSLDALRGAWPALLRRSRANGDAAELPALLRRLEAESPEDRQAADAEILELGPGVLEAVRKLGTTADPEGKARVAALLVQLEFLRELRSGP